MYFVVDIEATCWEQSGVRDNNEIIEIGIVASSDSGEVLGTFKSFVRPIISPKLSRFCLRLTKIKQEWIDSADPLEVVIPNIVNWSKDTLKIDSTKCLWGAFGEWDEMCLVRDCNRRRVNPPFGRFLNLKEKYAEFSGNANCGLREAIKNENLVWEGEGHRAFFDAVNASNLARKMRISGE